MDIRWGYSSTHQKNDAIVSRLIFLVCILQMCNLEVTNIQHLIQRKLQNSQRHNLSVGIGSYDHCNYKHTLTQITPFIRLSAIT